MISDSAVSTLHELHQSAAFKAALKELVEQEAEYCVQSMRNALAANQPHQAHEAHGALRLLEELPGMIAKYAAQYKPNRL
jgi:hypothetical protein